MSDLHASPLEDEPQTPLWLPALGAALFLTVALWWAVIPAAAPVIVADQAASASVPVATAAPPAPQPQVPENAVPAASARPTFALPPSGAGAEERMKKLRDQMNPRAPGGHR